MSSIVENGFRLHCVAKGRVLQRKGNEMASGVRAEIWGDAAFVDSFDECR
jgi:hypothetical protein